MILLSFDVEEFDMPFEYDRTLPFEEQISISETGTRRILDLLNKHQIKATFFCTATFALNSPALIQRMIKEGHEVASHGYYHSEFKPEHLLQSRKALETITNTRVNGFRMARMFPVEIAEVAKAGYYYNTSMNPTYLPGRYNNFFKPRRYFMEGKVLQVPASVTPVVRFPLFWLSFHNLPSKLYHFLCRWTHRKDGYLNLYYHPWEFTDLYDKEKFNFPDYVSKNSGDQMVQRFDKMLISFKKRNYRFCTFNEFVQEKTSELFRGSAYRLFSLK